MSDGWDWNRSWIATTMMRRRAAGPRRSLRQADASRPGRAWPEDTPEPREGDRATGRLRARAAPEYSHHASQEWEPPDYSAYRGYGYAERRRRARAADRPRSRDPLARLFPGLPHGVRVTLDWILTIVGAVAIVVLLKVFVVNPYRIPSSSMEPALNCAKARAPAASATRATACSRAASACASAGRHAETSSSSTPRATPRRIAAKAARSSSA